MCIRYKIIAVFFCDVKRPSLIGAWSKIPVAHQKNAMRGKGSNDDIAKNNAISLVSQETAKKLVALINSKGIN